MFYGYYKPVADFLQPVAIKTVILTELINFDNVPAIMKPVILKT